MSSSNLSKSSSSPRRPSKQGKIRPPPGFSGPPPGLSQKFGKPHGEENVDRFNDETFGQGFSAAEEFDFAEQTRFFSLQSRNDEDIQKLRKIKPPPPPLPASNPPSNPIIEESSPVLKKDLPPSSDFLIGGWWKNSPLMDEDSVTQLTSSRYIPLFGETSSEASKVTQEEIILPGLRGGDQGKYFNNSPLITQDYKNLSDLPSFVENFPRSNNSPNVASIANIKPVIERPLAYETSPGRFDQYSGILDKSPELFSPPAAIIGTPRTVAAAAAAARTAPISLADIEAELLLRKALNANVGFAAFDHLKDQPNGTKSKKQQQHGIPGLFDALEMPEENPRRGDRSRSGSFRDSPKGTEAEEQEAFLRLFTGLQVIPQPGGGVTVVKKASVPMTMEDFKAKEAWEHRRAIKERKLAKMAKYAGLMTQGDKEYIHKVQISQLVTDDPLADDFYCRMWTALRQQAPPTLELGRIGSASGKTTRQEQGLARQVQKIVSEARKRTKMTQLSLEGALGAVPITSVRNPKQSLQIKDSPHSIPPPKPVESVKEQLLNPEIHQAQEKRRILAIIEKLYDRVLALEQLLRNRPNGSRANTEREAKEDLERWQIDYTSLVTELWNEMKVNEPLGLHYPHTFIHILYFGKGKKLIGRAFRHCTPEQTLTMVTLLVASLNSMDVCRPNITADGLAQIEQFLNNVMPVVVACISDVPLAVLVGLMNVLLDKCNLVWLSRSKVGLAFLTLFLSRAEMLKQGVAISFRAPDERDLREWGDLHYFLLMRLRGSLAAMFPPPNPHLQKEATFDDGYVWQFLAAIAVGAEVEEQHILVAEVRDKVLENIKLASTLPTEQATQRINNVNLFLHALGLDASQVVSIT